MKIKFWGTRGSIPSPGPHTNKYGGNTPCIEVRTDRGELVILDAGMGIWRLGRSLMASEFGSGRGKGHILFSHTHWDHIQGFPFFPPLYVPGNEFTLYGSYSPSTGRLEEILEGQMDPYYAPMHSLKNLKAKLKFVETGEGALTVGGASVVVKPLKHVHPADNAQAFRIEGSSGAFVYTGDVEHPQGGIDGVVLEMARGADALVHDSQYTADEYYKMRVGWGHSFYDKVVEVAIQAGVKKAFFFHHDPERTDDSLDLIVESQRKKLSESGKGGLEIMAAAEGMELEI